MRITVIWILVNGDRLYTENYRGLYSVLLRKWTQHLAHVKSWWKFISCQYFSYVNSCSCHNSYYLFQYYGHINHSEYFVNDPSTPDLFDYEVPIHLLLPAIPVLIFLMVSSRGIPYWVLRQLCCGKFVL